MPTTLAPDNLILGSHAFFARDGASITLPSPGTSGPGVVPGDTDTAWVEIGTLKSTKPSPARGEPQEVWAPAPGGLRLKKLIRPKRDLKISITSRDVSPLVIELLFGAATLTDSSTTFVPLAKGGALTGWLRLEWYDQSDSKRLSTHLYVELVVADDIDFDPEKVVEVRFEARALLASAAYTGTIAAAA